MIITEHNKIWVLSCVFLTFLLFFLIFNTCNIFADDVYQKEMDKIAKKHFDASILLYKDSKISEAKIELQKALNLSPDNKETKDFLKKIEDEEFVVGKDEKFTDTIKEFYWSGMRYYRKEEFSMAIVEFEKALALAPKQEKILKFYNEVKEKIKPKEASNPAVIANDGHSPKVGEKSQKHPRKKYSKRNKNTVKSDSEVEDSKKKSNEFYKTGLINYKNGKFNESIFYFEQALKLNPSNLRARKSMERAKLKAGIKQAEKK